MHTLFSKLKPPFFSTQLWSRQQASRSCRCRAPRRRSRSIPHRSTYRSGSQRLQQRSVKPGQIAVPTESMRMAGGVAIEGRARAAAAGAGAPRTAAARSVRRGDNASYSASQFVDRIGWMGRTRSSGDGESPGVVRAASVSETSPSNPTTKAPFVTPASTQLLLSSPPRPTPPNNGAGGDFHSLCALLLPLHR